MEFTIHYRRVEEGTVHIEAPTLSQAQKELAVELACGTVPPQSFENHFWVIDKTGLTVENEAVETTKTA